MKNHPDDRSDNVEKIQNNIDNTVQNMEAAKEMIAVTDNDKTKKNLKEKNKRRGEALGLMKAEIQDEAKDDNKRRNN